MNRIAGFIVMESSNLPAMDFTVWLLKISTRESGFILQLVLLSSFWCLVSGLGSMSPIAVSYGENGAVFCGLKSDRSQQVSCYGANTAIVYGTPAHLQFHGLTAGNGFVCGLLMSSDQPYCWGNSRYIPSGVPQPMVNGAAYSEISAGDHHLCGLRKPLPRRRSSNSLIDCWGYNMTRNYDFDWRILSLSAGSEFNCGLLSQNKTAFCWGEDSSSRMSDLIPKRTRFRMIAAGGYHVCGILEDLSARVVCWGRSLNIDEATFVLKSTQGNIDVPPIDPVVSVVGGRFHACAIKNYDHTVICWGFNIKPSKPAPTGVKVYEIAAGDYFTCGVVARKSHSPVCWGLGFPTSLPLAVSPGLCKTTPCTPGTYELSREKSPCGPPDSHVCLPCSTSCPAEMYLKSECTPNSDRLCSYNCSSCISSECHSNCSDSSSPSNTKERKLWPVQLPVIIVEIGFALFMVAVVSITTVLYVNYRLRNCQCSRIESRLKKPSKSGSAFGKDNGRIRPDLDELKIRRAQAFTFEELERATGGFKEESLVGRGSFSCVYKGVLRDGTVVAVKKAIMSSDKQKNSNEFHTELDLLSRLNHAHLLNLLGYCEEGGERLLVYEFMAHGSLHQHLHGKNKALKEQLDWVRRVTIAVQASRGIEYLHGYACPPVIHRDIKSSNILIDEEHNARVSDFGLSLLGPADSSSPLAELPAGTLGYLDPEYYRLHYLTTKSDVYSFGVLLLEILSGRKAIDMQYEEGNIVEWAVPLIKSGDISAILDPVLKSPPDLEALKRIANVACKCVRMKGRERPSMDKVTTALERALAQLMGSPCSELPILPTEVVLGSSRMHKKASQVSSNRSPSDLVDGEDQRTEFRAPSWITFPSVTSSQRRKSSVSDADIEGRNQEGRYNGGGVDALRSLEEEIGPASPQQNLFLQHNF